MLVLSRRPDEKIVLPTVPAVIKILGTQAGLVRLGIEAPQSVTILREELFQANGPPLEVPPGQPGEPTVEELTPHLRHALRNRLNNLILGLALLRMQLVDQDPIVRKTLQGLEEEIEALRRCPLDPGRGIGCR